MKLILGALPLGLPPGDGWARAVGEPPAGCVGKPATVARRWAPSKGEPPRGLPKHTDGRVLVARGQDPPHHGKRPPTQGVLGWGKKAGWLDSTPLPRGTSTLSDTPPPHTMAPTKTQASILPVPARTAGSPSARRLQCRVSFGHTLLILGSIRCEDGVLNRAIWAERRS